MMLLVSMWGTLLVAQSAPTLDLPEAIRQAAANQPLLETAHQQRLGAQARLLQARSIEYPQLHFDAQAVAATANNNPATYVSAPDFARIGTVPAGTRSDNAPYMPELSSLIGVGAHYQVLDFGFTRGTVDAASSRAEAAAGESQALQDVILRVCEAYYSAAAAETLDVAQESLQRAETHHALAAAGVKSGMKPQIDLSRSDAELASAKLQLIRAQNAFNIGRSALDTAIGWAPHAYTLAPLSQNKTDEPLPSEAAALDQAVAARPDLAVLEASEQAASHQLKAAMAGNYPKLMATGSASVRGYAQAPNAFNWDVGLVLSLPLFTGFLVEGQTQEAEALTAEMHARRRSLRDIVAYQVRQARSNLLAARESVIASESQLAGATANLNQSEARYREGLGDIVQLADAQTQYEVAQKGLVDSRLAVALSAAQLAHACASLRVP